MFLDFAPRILRLAELTERTQSILSVRLAKDAFSAGENLVIAQGFVLRTVFPLAGRDCPELSTEEPTIEGISHRHMELMAILRGVDVHDFKGASGRQISHVAGEAQLTQCAFDYIHLFGIPNFFFHMTMGYATLRANGIQAGKGDFDGLHRYSPGFSFQE